MFKLIKWLVGSIFVVLAAAIGSVAGGQLRAMLFGDDAAGYRVAHEGPDGETTIAIQPMLTNVLPGLLAGLMGKPRPWRAFLVSAATALAVGDQYEQELLVRLGRRPGPSRPGW